MQPDPGGIKAASTKDPESLNRYSYVENDPINFTDRSGLLRCVWAADFGSELGGYSGGCSRDSSDFGHIPNDPNPRGGGSGNNDYRQPPRIKLLSARNLSDPISKDTSFTGSYTTRISLPKVNCTADSKFTIKITGILINVSDLYQFRPGSDKTAVVRSEMSFDPEDPFVIDFQSINVNVSSPKDAGGGDIYRDLSITLSIERVGNQTDIGGRLFMRLVGRGPNDQPGRPDQVIQEASIRFTCEQ